MKKDNGRTARRAQTRRIEEISKRIKVGDYPNCVQMAKEMQVSLKTVKRDIEFMRDELGWPIDYNQTRRGFYFTRSPDKGFGVGLGTDELRDLADASHAVSQYVGTPLEKLMREAFDQLKQNLGLNMTMADTLNGVLSFRPFAPVKIDIKALMVIAHAARHKRALQFTYREPGEEVEKEYRGLPYHISNINYGWYLFLKCGRARKLETFQIHMVREPKLLPQRFKGPKSFDLNQQLKDALIALAGKEKHEVIIDLDAEATDVIRHRHIPAIKEFTELPNRCARVLLRLSTLDEIEKWIFLLGIHATVLEPPQLRKRLLKISEELVRRYSQSPSQD